MSESGPTPSLTPINRLPRAAKRFQNIGAILCICGALASVAGCVSLDRLVRQHKLHVSVAEGTAFRHLVVRRQWVQPPATTLNVYLEGDGHPFQTRHRVSLDPTPRHPLALRLMIEDPGNAVYVGRPCYFGVHSDACQPRYWTVARYSPEIVDSLVEVINSLRQEAGATDVTLIGHSGGGTLAVLVAQRLDAVGAVITLSANLDIDAWADLHGYTRLAQSINPSTISLPSSLRQFHAQGAADRNVPPASIEAFTAANPDAFTCVLPRCAHTDCWLPRWHGFLTNLRTGREEDLCDGLQSR